jgi:hypothetical protein
MSGDRCPDCGASYALVGRAHVCRPRPAPPPATPAPKPFQGVTGVGTAVPNVRRAVPNVGTAAISSSVQGAAEKYLVALEKRGSAAADGGSGTAMGTTPRSAKPCESAARPRGQDREFLAGVTAIQPFVEPVAAVNRSAASAEGAEVLGAQAVRPRRRSALRVALSDLGTPIPNAGDRTEPPSDLS